MGSRESPHWSPAALGATCSAAAPQLEHSRAHSLQESLPASWPDRAGQLPVSRQGCDSAPAWTWANSSYKTQSAKLQSEDLNQANPHPAKRRTVLGAGRRATPTPGLVPLGGLGSRAPLRGGASGEGQRAEPVATFLRRVVSRSLGSGLCGLRPDLQGFLSAVPLSKAVSCPACEAAKSGRACVTVVVTSLSQNTS